MGFRLIRSLFSFQHFTFNHGAAFPSHRRGHALCSKTYWAQPARAQQRERYGGRERSVQSGLTEQGAFTGGEDSGAAKDGTASAVDIGKDLSKVNAETMEENIPSMHFCEFTNEPTDICNAQWLVVSLL